MVLGFDNIKQNRRFGEECFKDSFEDSIKMENKKSLAIKKAMLESREFKEETDKIKKELIKKFSKLINKEKKNWLGGTDWDVNLKQGLKKLEDGKTIN
jgi:hypothetical protein